jgi:hypothetical protein
MPIRSLVLLEARRTNGLLAGKAGSATALALALLAGGCVRVPPPDLSRDPAGLLAQVREGQARVQSVRGSARVGVSSRSGSGSLDAWLVAERPDRVRIETFDFFGNVVAVLVADASRFALYDARAGVLYRGEPTPENLARLLPVALPPSDLAVLLCGSAPLLEGLPVEAQPDGGRMRLALEGAGGRETLWVGDGAAISEARLEPRAGAGPGWQVTFDSFRRRAGAPFPTDAELRSRGAEVSVRWEEDVQVNAAPDPSLFRLDPPRGARVQELSPGAPPPPVDLPLGPRPAGRG